MGSSKKHKKHKEKDKERGEKRSHEQSGASPATGTGIGTGGGTVEPNRSLKLVLKVGSGSSTTVGHSPMPMPMPLPISMPTPVKEEQTPEVSSDDGPPKLTLTYDPLKGEMTSTAHGSSSSKKAKKKKSKKKHKKHSHHHHHHSSHSSHSHRHRSSCSHSRRSSHSHEQRPLVPLISEGNATDVLAAPVANTSAEADVILSPVIPPVPIICKPKPQKMATKQQFQMFLLPLLKQIQRRDAQEFFAWPVTDMIAPGYSTIITRPMDFITLKKKLDQGLYDNIPDFKADVKLMCDNAMAYNHPETIYYRAARKLWHFAKEKVLSRSVLADYKKMYSGIGPYELGFSVDEQYQPMEVDSSMPVFSPDDPTQPMSMSDLTHQFSAFDDTNDSMYADESVEEEITPEEILAVAQKAANAAAHKLTLQRPYGAHLSMLRQRNDGSTSLSIVGTPEYITAERTVCIEDLVGRLHEGSTHLCAFKEIVENRVRPVEALHLPPFASYLPSVDSSKANISAEDTALIMSTYGEDEVGLQYAQSLLQFTCDSDYMTSLVDNLLNVLTHGQHLKLNAKIKEQNLKDDKDEKDVDKAEDTIKKVDEIQEQLDDASSLVNQLESVQHQRLSSSTRPIQPSNDELSIASQLSTKLTEIISSHVVPVDVTDIKSIRKAMGITLKGE